MGTGLSQVNFLWLCERFSRSPFTLWYSLRSTSSALGSVPPLPPPPAIQSDQFPDSKLHRICHFGCMWFQLYPLKWWQTVITGRPNNCLLPHLYSGALCPSFTYSPWPHFSPPTSPTLLSPSSSQKRQEYRKQSILIFSVKYGNFCWGKYFTCDEL